MVHMFYGKVIKNGKVSPGHLGGKERSYKNKINVSLELLHNRL